MKGCLPRKLELLARRAFGEYLADGDGAEERADDVLGWKLSPMAQTVTTSSWSRSSSCARSDVIDILMPTTYSLTYENDDPTFRRSTAQGQEEGRRARPNSNLAG
jgi:hypothetical protein